MSKSKLDSAILELEASAQDLEVFADDGSLNPQSPKLANAVFGSARVRSLSKQKDASRRDSPTLPWQGSNSRLAPPATKRAPQASKPRATPARPDSPDISVMLAKTPRPRKSTSSMFSSSSQSRTPSKKAPKPPIDDESLISDFGTLLELDSDFEEGGSASDSSLDIHTPLPHLMFRDGLLSPRSKLLPQSTSTSTNSPYAHEGEDGRAGSVLSLASTAGSVMTGLQKDPRDTHRRRIRHRDGRLLRAGMGLTTGLGWSDSEDEDAPSPLTRQLIRSTVDRQRSGSLNSTSSRPGSQYDDKPISRFASPTPSKLGLTRKDSSYSSMRATPARMSSPANISTQGAGVRIARGRSTSAASAASSAFSTPSSVIATPPLGMARVPFIHENSSTSSLVFSNGITDASAVEVSHKTLASKLPTVVPRQRAESVTSNGSGSTTQSYAPSDSHEVPSATAARHTPRPRTNSTTSVSRIPSKPSKPNGILRPRLGSNASTYNPLSNLPEPVMTRSRTTSTTSTSTNTTASHATNTSNTTTASEGSQYSSSTASSGPAVPRPLRLPQSTTLASPNRSFSQGPLMNSSSVINTATSYHRVRTLSNPQSSVRLPISPAQPRVMTTSRSLSSGVLPPGSPPTLRQRQAPNGARPRPRTGTGMVYRTSSTYSFASFHESGSKMRGLSLANYAQTSVAI